MWESSCLGQFKGMSTSCLGTQGKLNFPPYFWRQLGQFIKWAEKLTYNSNLVPQLAGKESKHQDSCASHYDLYLLSLFLSESLYSCRSVFPSVLHEMNLAWTSWEISWNSREAGWLPVVFFFLCRNYGSGKSCLSGIVPT